ncbi:hypothetical protein [Nocardia sp. NPDC049707]|uniref:hypothetical protein n=1 Tax=Nocardia sp. NPDC049707 TaxID=3154735 RepID=UPI00343E355F
MTVIIGIGPHKRSATIEIIDHSSTVLATGRYSTDTTGYSEMLTAARQFPERIWAIEGCNGVGRHLAHRLIHHGEIVIDVPAELSAQVRVFATGNGAKPARSTPIRLRWPHYGHRICDECKQIRNSSHSDCWSIVAMNSAAHAPNC